MNVEHWVIDSSLILLLSGVGGYLIYAAIFKIWPCRNSGIVTRALTIGVGSGLASLINMTRLPIQDALYITIVGGIGWFFIALVCLWVISIVTRSHDIKGQKSKSTDKQQIAKKNLTLQQQSVNYSGKEDSYIKSNEPTLQRKNDVEKSSDITEPCSINAPLISTLKDSNFDDEREWPEEHKLWEEALIELNQGNYDRGLWARCFAKSEGDRDKASAMYIKSRVAQMRLPVNLSNPIHVHKYMTKYGVTEKQVRRAIARGLIPSELVAERLWLEDQPFKK